MNAKAVLSVATGSALVFALFTVLAFAFTGGES
jgi:hypothetical protein